MKAREQEPEGFSAFWTEWRPYMRHTDGRGDARDRYRKELLRGADPLDILDGAKGYLRHLTSLPKEKQDFIPLAATWLHKQSYADWCDRERAYQARLAEAQARRATPAPRPAPEPVVAETEDRAAIVRRVYERQGIRPPGELH